MQTAMPNFPPAGIWPVLYAFFDAHNRLDREAMRLQVDHVIDAGAPGIVILGLATEVRRLSAEEKHQLIDWASSDIDKRVPLAVTLNGDTPEAQIELADHALDRGAQSFILQPPNVQEQAETWYFDFFSEVMRRLDAPCGIQNAPEYLGVGLSTGALVQLAAQQPNFLWLKGEGSALTIGATIETLRAHDSPMPVFNGRGGLELVDNLRAGCAGLIVAPDTFDKQTRIYDAFMRGDVDHAQIAYRDILPAIVFVMQSLESLTCYGKRIAAWRMGFDVAHDRGSLPSAFGLACAQRVVAGLGQFAV